MIKKTVDSFSGFRFLRTERGLRLSYIMPAELVGKLHAELLCRGSLLDGTEGMPSRIFQRLGDELGSDVVIAPWQVHGTAVAEGRSVWAFPQRIKADGVFLDRQFDPQGRVRASLRFADCAPILVASAFPRPWALVLHSGFRGTILGIFPTAWQKICSFFGETDPARTFVWIGPAIGGCCYTRKRADPMTESAIQSSQGHFVLTDDETAHFDLLGAIEEQIRTAAGIARENISKMDLCTFCNRDLFYSYRAGDLRDRMILIAKLS